MLKFEYVKVGCVIRALDFKPVGGAPARYVEGRVLRHEEQYGARFLVILCTVDTLFGGSDDMGRVGEEVYVPMEMCVCDFDERVVILEAPEGYRLTKNLMSKQQVLVAADTSMTTGSSFWNRTVTLRRRLSGA